MIRSHVRNAGVAVLAAAVVTALAAAPARADLKLPRPSPKAVVSQTIGLTDFTVTYSRPGVKGRKIWGELVPYGEVWRTGANEATSFVTTGEATVAGKKLPAGEYSLYTIPGEKEWTVIVSTEKGAWGSFKYAKEDDAHRFTVKPAAAPSQEWMEFAFENLTPSSADLVLRWEKLQLSIPIEVATQEQAMANVKAAMAEAKPDDWQTPYRCAQYCFNAGVNLDEAMTWAERSVAAKPAFFNLSLLADMKMKAGNSKEAIAVGERALKAGQEDPEKPDTRAMESKLQEWKGKKS
ncbi:MAG TPA: DUF2911 domain-containing protein [Candidatus Eisenbacteria bacterium]|nr:DUF2911 domain-containing protein [Candidatus Eisenbacteria bacterium]